MSGDDAHQSMPRRRKSGGRAHRTVIRHTAEEWAEVTALASQRGVSVPGLYEYALRALAGPPKTSELGGGGAAPNVRRPRTGKGARTRRTIIRHSDAEWARVTAMAAHLGVSVPAFYERAAFAGSAQAAVELSIIEDELFGVRRLLSNAANNLNQVARSVNTDGTFHPEQLAASLRLFDTTVARLNDLLGRLPGSDQ